MNVAAKTSAPMGELTKYQPPAEASDLEAWPRFPDEIILDGDPAHRGTVLYRDPSKLYSIGIWSCPPCKFRMDYAGTESGHVLRGKARLTNEKTGASITIAAGDRFLIPFGESILWEVLEPFQKHYHMFESEWADDRYY